MLVNPNNFNDAIDNIKRSKTVVFDTETQGLRSWGENRDKMIGYVCYLPEYDVNYYFPFLHGYGQFTDLTFDDVRGMTWQGDSRKAVMTDKVYQRYLAKDVRQYNLTDKHKHLLIEALTPDKTYIAHNAQFDLNVIYNEGFNIPDTVLDTRILVHVYFSDWTGKTAPNLKYPDGSMGQVGRGLKNQAKFRGLIDMDDNEEANLEASVDALKDRLLSITKRIVVKQAKAQSYLWAMYPSEVEPYACMDTRLTWQLYNLYMDKIKQWDNVDFFHNLCDIQLKALWRMQRTGFTVDTDLADQMILDSVLSQDELLDKIRTHTNNPKFNPNSPSQVVKYLGSQGIDVEKANKEVLEQYRDNIPVLFTVQKYKAIGKEIGTYVKKWRDNTLELGTDKEHPSFNSTGTKTYRLSSAYQQFPRKADSPYAPKKLVLPNNPEWCLVEADYKGLETYTTAWIVEHLMPQDSTPLIDLLINDADMHAYTADSIGLYDLLLQGFDSVRDYMLAKEYDLTGLSAEEIDAMYYSKEVRQTAKTVNFAMMYGGGATSLQNSLDINRTLAKTIRDGWQNAYPTIVKATNDLQSLALKLRPMPNGKGKTQYITYPLEGFNAHRKYSQYPTWYEMKNGSGFNPRDAEARKALNSISQGTAALLMQDAARRVSERFPSDDIINLHLTVHDSIIFSCHPDNLEFVCKEVKEIMEDYPIYPKLIADFEVCPAGKAWAYKEKYSV